MVTVNKIIPSWHLYVYLVIFFWSPLGTNTFFIKVCLYLGLAHKTLESGQVVPFTKSLTTLFKINKKEFKKSIQFINSHWRLKILIKNRLYNVALTIMMKVGNSL